MPVDILQARSDLLRRLRQFFHDHGFLEVETPLVGDEAIPELHIEPFTVGARHEPASRSDAASTELFFQASPELHMKRLMADGAEAIFQITRSFRAGELGRLHQPEFTIVEWYRRGDDMRAGIQFLDDFCQSLLKTPSAVRTCYAAAFEKHVGLCPHTANTEPLAERAHALGVTVPQGFASADRDTWLNLLLSTRVEPHLGHPAPEILFDYPASQAALAKIRDDGTDPPIAERFELYWRGVELANGYHELTDAVELRERFERVNEMRVADGRAALPLPESLLAAMDRGLPNCTGVALGFDRLLMLAVGAESISEVMAFPPNRNIIESTLRAYPKTLKTPSLTPPRSTGEGDLG